MYLNSDKCIRCGLPYSGTTRQYAETKSISCPYCGSISYRVKSIYRETLRESFVCTNENCYVRVVVISIRHKERKQ